MAMVALIDRGDALVSLIQRDCLLFPWPSLFTIAITIALRIAKKGPPLRTKKRREVGPARKEKGRNQTK